MLIQCPKCQRKGDIPDRFGLTPHSVRCRTCQTKFMTVPLGLPHSGDRPTMPLLVNSTEEHSLCRHVSPPSFGDFPAGEVVSTTDEHGPGDSHYEWPVIDDTDADESQVELRTFAAEDHESSDEIPVISPESPSGEIVIGEPTSHRSAAISARYRFAAAIVIRVLLLSILGYFILQAVLNARHRQCCRRGVYRGKCRARRPAAALARPSPRPEVPRRVHEEPHPDRISDRPRPVHGQRSIRGTLTREPVDRMRLSSTETPGRNIRHFP